MLEVNVLTLKLSTNIKPNCFSYIPVLLAEGGGPGNIYLFKVNNTNTNKDVKYVQN